MIRTAIAATATALIAILFAPLAIAAASTARSTQSAQVTAADAAPFMGDWTLDLQGPNGPAAFDLTVKVEKDKVVGAITGGTMATQPIEDVTKADKTLILSYSFNYEGNAVSAVVSLTPGPEGKTAAQIDFAGGAYIMSGSATKKEKAK